MSYNIPISLKIDSSIINEKFYTNKFSNIDFHIYYEEKYKNILNNVIMFLKGHNNCKIIIHYNSITNSDIEYCNNNKFIISLTDDYINHDNVFRRLIVPKIDRLLINVTKRQQAEDYIKNITTIMNYYNYYRRYYCNFEFLSEYIIDFKDTYNCFIDNKNNHFLYSLIYYNILDNFNFIEKHWHKINYKDIYISTSTNILSCNNNNYKKFIINNEFYKKIFSTPKKCLTCGANMFCAKHSINDCETTIKFYNSFAYYLSKHIKKL